MLNAFCLAACLLAPPQAADPAPTLAEVRKGMGIPSQGAVRGQQDAVGFASTAAQMAAVWQLSSQVPPPEGFGHTVSPGAVGAILPHDDYVYAGPTYRRVIPGVTAKTVILIGVFHKFRRFGVRDRLIFDTYRSWRAPDGEIPISPLRETLLAGLQPGDAQQDAAMHDSEHSLEAIAYWLKHQRSDLEILPILVPVMTFERMQQLAERLGSTLTGHLKDRGLSLGKDVAIVISSDGVHYGADFRHVPFGAGGAEAFQQAMATDRRLLTGPLSDPLTVGKAREFFATCVDPAAPDTYRLTWCGRYSIPFGMLFLEATSRAFSPLQPVGIPLALGVSVDTPGLPVAGLGLGATAPANLYHFVSYPGVVYTLKTESHP